MQNIFLNKLDKQIKKDKCYKSKYFIKSKNPFGFLQYINFANSFIITSDDNFYYLIDASNIKYIDINYYPFNIYFYKDDFILSVNSFDYIHLNKN